MSKYLHALPQGLDNPAKYSEQQGQWTEMMVVDVYRTQKKLRNELGMQICGVYLVPTSARIKCDIAKLFIISFFFF